MSKVPPSSVSVVVLVPVVVVLVFTILPWIVAVPPLIMNEPLVAEVEVERLSDKTKSLGVPLVPTVSSPVLAEVVPRVKVPVALAAEATAATWARVMLPVVVKVPVSNVSSDITALPAPVPVLRAMFTVPALTVAVCPASKSRLFRLPA